MMYTLRSLCLLVTIITGVVADAPLIHDFKGYNTGSYGINPNQSYHSSNITSPLWQVNSWNRTAYDPTGYILTAFPEKWAGLYHGGAGKFGPYIFSAKDLSLVYAAPLFHSSKMLGVQEYNGTSYMTIFAGRLIDASHGNGRCYLIDRHYQVAHVISAVNAPQNVDLHECLLTANGTAVITSYYNIPYDLTPVGGPKNGTLIDSMFQEVDIATGDLIYEWKASEHYPLSYTHSNYTADNYHGGFDWFHLNSVEKTNEGHYLISAFISCLIGYINGTSGDPIWTLGGRGNNFSEPSHDGATKIFSHHARFRNKELTEISYFDNTIYSEEVGCTENCSKGRIVKINTTDWTAVNLKQYRHPLSLQAGAEGSFTVTDSGTVFIGWGESPTITEHRALSTECIFDVQFSIFGTGFDNYRAFKSNWVGEPLWPPSIASGTDGNSSVVWVSWNGATEVTDWVLLGADDANATIWNSSQVLTTATKRGFETSIAINSTVKYARVAGLDLSGVMLGSTDVVEIATGFQSTAAGPIVLNNST